MSEFELGESRHSPDDGKVVAMTRGVLNLMGLRNRRDRRVNASARPRADGYYVHNDDDWPEQICGVVTPAQMDIVIGAMTEAAFKTAVLDDLKRSGEETLD